MIRLIIYSLLIFLLLILSVQDIREQKVYWGPVYGVIAIALIYVTALLISGESNIARVIIGIMPGILMLGIRLMTTDQLGVADCIIVAAVGSILQTEELLIMLSTMCGMMIVVAIVLLMCHKAGKNSRIPMIPFIVIGTLLGMIYGLGKI